jgi:polyisoprenoid-binding protein YceI
MFRKLSILFRVATLLLLSACNQPPVNTGGDVAAELPPHKHAHASVYRLDPEQSSIILKVYKDGPLARFGHNHVIAVGSLSGTVYREKELARSDFELTIPAIQLMVDRAADRAAAGTDFAGELTPFAVAGTRENMLGPKLLAADQYPDIKIESVAVKGELPDVVFTVKITVRGIESQVLLPARLTFADNALSADGHFVLSQAQLGLNPYSVLGGGLRVRDTIDVNYHLQATRDSASAANVNGKK